DHRDRVPLHGQPARVVGVGRDRERDPAHARGVGHRQVVAVAQRDLGGHLDLPAEVQQERAVATLCTDTPSIAASAATMPSACASSLAAHVTSTLSLSAPPDVTSSAVTTPPACSTTRVISLTARPREATSSRTVIE